MDKNKIKFLKEKELEKKAQKKYEFLKSQYAQDPMKAKFIAFQKTKKEIDLKDFF